MRASVRPCDSPLVAVRRLEVVVHGGGLALLAFGALLLLALREVRLLGRRREDAEDAVEAGRGGGFNERPDGNWEGRKGLMLCDYHVLNVLEL